MFHFYTPWKQKTSGFLMFSGVIEVEHWLKMGKCSWTIFHLGFAWIIYGKNVIRTFLGTFFGRPYLSNGTKIHLDVALSFTFYHKVIFFGGRNSIDDQVRSWFVYLNATWIVLLESNTSLFLCLSGFVKHNYILFIASCMTCFSLQYSCQKKKKKKKKKNRELHLSVFNTIYQWIKGPWCLGTWFRTSFQNCLPLIWLFPPWCYPKFIPFSQNSSTHMHAPKVPYEILPTWIMKVSSSKICCDCHSPVLRLSSGSNTLRESVF